MRGLRGGCSAHGSCALLLGLMSYAFAAGAQTDVRLSEQAFLEEMPVVLTASRLSQSAADAPSAITVLDRDLIRASGVRDLPDIFRFVPGMYVTYQAYVHGLQGVVSYHGLASELAGRMQVLIDGRAVYNPTLGDVSWSGLPVAIEDIERIEIVRGPSAASHGANSFLGVINIITQHPAQAQGTYASLKQGNTGIRDRLLRHGGTQGDFDYRLTAGYRADSGSDLVADSRSIHLLTFRGDYRIDNRDVLELQFGYNGGPAETQGATTNLPSPVDFPREFRSRNYFEQTKWRRALDQGGEVSLQFHHNHLGYTDRYTTLPIVQVGNLTFELDDSIDADRYDLELQHSTSPARNVRTVWGASVRRDSVVAPQTLAGPARNDMWRYFAHAEWRAAPHWLLNAGLMIERTDYTGVHTSPRVALTWQPAHGQALRVAVSRALRNPSLFEEAADRKYQFGPLLVQRFLSSGDLQPERILSRELAYVAESPDRTWGFDVRVFNDRLEQLVNALRVPYPQGFGGSTLDFLNLNYVRQKGVESQLRLRPERGLQLGVTQAYIVTESQDVGDNYSQSTPRNSHSFYVLQDIAPEARLSLTWVHQHEMRPLGYSERQASWERVDLRLAQRFRAGSVRAEAALTIQNLLDADYTEFRHDNVFRRRSFVSLSAEF